jgi:hypothetical protein
MHGQTGDHGGLGLRGASRRGHYRDGKAFASGHDCHEHARLPRLAKMVASQYGSERNASGTLRNTAGITGEARLHGQFRSRSTIMVANVSHGRLRQDVREMVVRGLAMMMPSAPLRIAPRSSVEPTRKMQKRWKQRLFSDRFRALSPRRDMTDTRPSNETGRAEFRAGQSFIGQGSRGLEFVSIGESFTSTAYAPSGRHVPCVIKLRSGKVITNSMALKRDGKPGRWCLR